MLKHKRFPLMLVPTVPLKADHEIGPLLEALVDRHHAGVLGAYGPNPNASANASANANAKKKKDNRCVCGAATATTLSS